MKQNAPAWKIATYFCSCGLLPYRLKHTQQAGCRHTRSAGDCGVDTECGRGSGRGNDAVLERFDIGGFERFHFGGLKRLPFGRLERLGIGGFHELDIGGWCGCRRVIDAQNACIAVVKNIENIECGSARHKMMNQLSTSMHNAGI